MKQPRRLIPAIALAIDAVLVVAALLLGVLLRDQIPGFGEFPAARYGWRVVVPIAIVWLIAIRLMGSYRWEVFGAGTDEYKQVVHATVLSAAAVGIVCYLTEFELSRGFFVISFGIGIPLLVLGRYAARFGLKSARRRGALRHRVLVTGDPSHIDEIATVLRRETWLGYDVVGALSSTTLTETASGVDILGGTDDVADEVRTHDIDTLFVAGGAFTSAASLRQVVWDLEPLDVQVVVAPEVTDVASERVAIRPVGGMPLVHLDPPRSAAATRWAKRTFDLIGASVLLVGFAPLLAVAALRVRLHDGGPVLFRQTRLGRDGQAFACLKLRTMVVDAEERREALLAQADHDEGLFKLADDPRITGPGRWLRRYSVDELPQLVNVLRGDMSLVGPRPPLAEEVQTYTPQMHRRLRVRPGMTGLWQVSGRSDLSWEDAIRLDLYYVDNWSMLQDLIILVRTFGAVLRSRGAY